MEIVDFFDNGSCLPWATSPDGYQASIKRR